MLFGGKFTTRNYPCIGYAYDTDLWFTKFTKNNFYNGMHTIDKNLHRDNKLSTIIKFKDICGHKRPIRNNSFLQQIF